MTSRKLDSFFSESGSPLSRLALAAQRLNVISRIWETVAPIGLARSCRVGRLDDTDHDTCVQGDPVAEYSAVV